MVYRTVRIFVQVNQGRLRLLAKYCADERLVVDVTVTGEEAYTSGCGQQNRERMRKTYAPI